MAAPPNAYELKDPEAVRVSQRALVDKILARYPGAFTVFRELLQNADDAQACAAEIRFETLSNSLVEERKAKGKKKGMKLFLGTGVTAHELQTSRVDRWVFKNNGNAFEEADWDRLKTIADGNPDEGKVGAFGVGFYSVFSVTDRPQVSSGGAHMTFGWEGDNLRARCIMDLPRSEWSTFELPLRDPVPFSKMFELVQFLASSLPFMAYLCQVKVFFDDKLLVSLRKDSESTEPISIPEGLKTKTPKGLMNIQKVTKRSIKIETVVLSAVYTSMNYDGALSPTSVYSNEQKYSPNGSFFCTEDGNYDPGLIMSRSRGANRENSFKESVVLQVFSADVEVIAKGKFEKDLQRCTKKSLPITLSYDLIFTSKKGYDDALSQDDAHPFPSGSVLKWLRSNIDGSSSTWIYIGHATSQTTGMGGHMQAVRFVSAVDRESIDLENRTVADWNKELLHIGGFLSRTVYEIELAQLRSAWEVRSASGSSTRDLRDQAMHIIKYFTFYPSTPSRNVSVELERAFFSCSNTNGLFPVLSTAGILVASEVRRSDPTFSNFMKRQIVLSDGLPKRMEEALLRGKVIKEITFADVLAELRARPLSPNEMSFCLGWWIRVSKGTGLGDSKMLEFRRKMLDVARVKTTSIFNPIVSLSSVRIFINRQNLGAFIPADGPFPRDILPLSLSQGLDLNDLADVFDWREFSLNDWINYLLDGAGMDSAADQSVTALFACLGRCWNRLSSRDQDDIRRMLSTRSCIPTTLGPRRPEETYLSSIDLFKDLPVVKLPPMVEANVDVLLGLGIQFHLDLKTILTKMTTTENWSTPDIISHLRRIQPFITQEDRALLHATRAFRAAVSDKQHESESRRYCLRELYEPQDVFRKLGLPVLEWPENKSWSGVSDHEKFANMLGLKRNPSLEQLIGLCASTNTSTRSEALQYLIDNMNNLYEDYDPIQFPDVPFIPATKDGVECVALHTEVVGDQKWSSLGFLTAKKGLDLSKLKISDGPSPTNILKVLRSNPPQDRTIAYQWFSLLAEIEFNSEQIEEISRLQIVPTDHGIVSPSACYLDQTDISTLHVRLFSFVDFGKRGNRFLDECQAKGKPSVADIADALSKDPQNFFCAAERDQEVLISEIRHIALHYRLLSSNIIDQMKDSSCLPALRRQQEKEGETACEVELRKPEEIMIVDDMHTERLFADTLWAAPKEEKLEEFYAYLGSKRLSKLLAEKVVSVGKETRNSKLAQKIRNCILERLPLFLRDRPDVLHDVTIEWFASQERFTIKTCNDLIVVKSIIGLEDKVDPIHRSVSASANRDGGVIELWILDNSDWDKYEVAVSLCRLIFDIPRVHDALLFHTILSTDLDTLQRRGYDLSNIGKHMNITQNRDRKDRDSHIVFLGKINGLSSWTISPKGLFKNLSSAREVSISQKAISPNEIALDIEEAIRLCNGEKGVILRNKEYVHARNNKDLKGGSGYCHQGRFSDELRLIGEVRGVGVYGVLDGRTLDREVLDRFISLIFHLAPVFTLKLGAFHVFYDYGRPEFLGFNRKQSIFLNLRYYEEHHDSSVKRRSLNEPYIFWYFTIAHEIAHNSFPHHDAQHELLFSAICQKYLVHFTHLLGKEQL